MAPLIGLFLCSLCVIKVVCVRWYSRYFALLIERSDRKSNGSRRSTRSVVAGASSNSSSTTRCVVPFPLNISSLLFLPLARSRPLARHPSLLRPRTSSVDLGIPPVGCFFLSACLLGSLGTAHVLPRSVLYNSTWGLGDSQNHVGSVCCICVQR